MWRNSLTSRRRTIVACTIIGLLVQAFLGALQASAMALAAAAAADPFARSIIICTPTGFKKVSIDGNGNPVEEPKQPEFGLSCCICHATSCANAAVQPGGLRLEAPKSSLFLSQLPESDRIRGRRPLVRHCHDPPYEI
jgi:hypothetical protein